MSRSERFICLDRRGTAWRMDSVTFQQFMKHVSMYFGMEEAVVTTYPDDINYAEISGDDLSTVSAIFGGYSPDENRIFLVPVHPQRFILPLRKTFDVNIFDSKNDHQQHLQFKAK